MKKRRANKINRRSVARRQSKLPVRSSAVKTRAAMISIWRKPVDPFSRAVVLSFFFSSRRTIMRPRRKRTQLDEPRYPPGSFISFSRVTRHKAGRSVLDDECPAKRRRSAIHHRTSRFWLPALSPAAIRPNLVR